MSGGCKKYVGMAVIGGMRVAAHSSTVAFLEAAYLCYCLNHSAGL